MTDQTDDALCFELERYGISYFRGDLENVLKRYCDAIVDYAEDTKIFRLTADNPLVDGAFLDEMEAAFDSAGVDIMNSDSDEIGMPKGISAELTTVGKIREALKLTCYPYDLEHVTPYIYRNGVSKGFCSKSFLASRNLRVGIDTLHDYTSVRSLFHGESNPVEAQISVLLNNHHKMMYRPFCGPPSKPIILSISDVMGGGDENTYDELCRKLIMEIIRQGITEGVECVETDMSFVGEEKVIGEAISGGWASRVKLVVKPFSLHTIDISKDDAQHLSWILRKTVLQSFINLGVDHVDTLMVRSTKDLEAVHVYNELKNIRTEGLVSNIGVCVNSPKELKFALSMKEVNAIEMPYNILDCRWDELIHEIKRARENRGLVIHARHSLPAALSFSHDNSGSNHIPVNVLSSARDWLSDKCERYGRHSLSDLSIGYVASHDWVDSIVMQVNSKEDLVAKLRSVASPLMSAEVITGLNLSKPVFFGN